MKKILEAEELYWQKRGGEKWILREMLILASFTWWLMGGGKIISSLLNMKDRPSQIMTTFRP
jgi:hypothetical protein